MVIEVKLAVTGMALYDYDLRLSLRLGLGLNIQPINRAASLEAGHHHKSMIQQHH